MKRILALLLALILCLSIFPAEGLAEDPPSAEETSPAEEPPVSGSCGKSVTWSYDAESAVLCIEGSGKMKDYEELDGASSAPWAAFHLAAVEIGTGVASIGNYAFAYSDLAAITISTSVTSIGDYAFADCAALQEIVLPDKLTSIGKSAFFGCESLAAVYIPAKVNYIGKAAFSACRTMTQITVDPYNYTFRSKGGVLFSRDGSKLINCPAGLGESYSIPSGVRSIRGYAFNGAQDLCEVSIPLSVTSIGRYAFADCPNLGDIFYAGSRSQWKRIKIHTDDNYGFDALLTAAVHHNA